MVGKIRNVGSRDAFTNGILQWCDKHGICCGVDDRRWHEYGVIKYTFANDGKGLIIVVDFDEVINSQESLENIFNKLEETFCVFERPFFDYFGIARRVEVMQEIAQYKKKSSKFEIEKVIFNNPATIVFWADGTKTVVKRQKGDRYDKEKGLAMAIAKKLYGNTGKYCDIFKEHMN